MRVAYNVVCLVLFFLFIYFIFFFFASKISRSQSGRETLYGRTCNQNIIVLQAHFPLCMVVWIAHSNVWEECENKYQMTKLLGEGEDGIKQLELNL